jgi:hypothetical protein
MTTRPGWYRAVTERFRQIDVEGYDLEHDAKEDPEDLVLAAIAYAMPHREPDGARDRLWVWPWNPAEFKPSTRARDLEKAAALLMAALDRLED